MKPTDLLPIFIKGMLALTYRVLIIKDLLFIIRGIPLRIQPLGDRLVVKVAEVTEEKTKSGLYVPDTAKENLKKQKYSSRPRSS